MNTQKILLVKSSIKNATIYSTQELMVANFVQPQKENEHIQLINDESIDHLTIVESCSNKPLGHIILNISSIETIEFRRIVIYPRLKGYGKAAISLILKYIRTQYPECKVVWLDVYSYNQIAQNLYVSAGFTLQHVQGDLLIYHYLINS